MRDQGLLDSAVAQAQATFEGKQLHSFPWATAAAYLFHLVQNHPFLDGNKRTGAASALVFLDMNDIEVTAPPGTLYEITMAVARGASDKLEVARFFQKHAP